MNIRRMKANFGVLEGRELRLREGMNILVSPNESGKSTWCAFLCAMLYGVDTSRRERAGVKPDKTLYAPWGGAPMSGELELEHGGRGITLRRWTKTASAPMREFSAVYTDTDLPVPGLDGANAGETLLGVPRDVFERSAFIRQAGAAVTSTAELEKRIAAIAATGGDETAWSETDALLRTWLRRRRYNKRGLLPENEAELDEARRQRDAIKSAAAECARLDEQARAQRGQIETLTLGVREARARQRKDALASLGRIREDVRVRESELDGARTALAASEDAIRRSPLAPRSPEQAREETRADAGRAEEIERAPRGGVPALLLLLPFIICAVTAALGILFSPFIFAASALSAAAGVWLVLRARKLSGERAALDRELGDILSKYSAASSGDITALAGEYMSLWTARAAAKRAVAASESALAASRARQGELETRLPAELDFAEGQSEAARLGRDLAQAQTRLRELAEERARVEGSMRTLGDPLVIDSRIGELEGRRAELQEQYDDLSLAIDTLREADGEIQQRVSPALGRRASELYARLTAGRYDSMSLDRSLAARATLSGDTVARETAFLSTGAAEQLYLALRIAICELALPAGERCPLVLDDALVSFDDGRMTLALDLLRELAGGRQVLLFSCQGREADYFKNDRGVTIGSV